MRVIALLSLLFGFIGLGLLDGQTFTHAVMGIVFGAAAVTCGMASARRDPAHRWEGWIMAALGAGLGLWCIVLLPSGYRFQKQFNDRREQGRHQDGTPANKPAAGKAGITLQLAIGQHRSGLPEPGR
jgi:hypothetical protein